MVLINPYFIGFAAMDGKIKSDKSSKPDKLSKGSVGSDIAWEFSKLPTRSLDEAIAIRDHLLEHNSAYTAKRIWVQLNACGKWAQRSKLITENPFADMADDFRLNVTGSDQVKDIDSFFKAEMETVVAAFENHPHHSHYAPFVKFLFWTGARTSEAVGLRWKHVSPDFKTITFSEAVVNVSSKGIRKCTKTKKPMYKNQAAPEVPAVLPAQIS